MKFVKITAILLLCFLLGACNNSKEEIQNDYGEERLLELVVNHNISEEFNGLDHLPHLIINEGTGSLSTMLQLVDLMSGEVLATYELGDYEVVTFKHSLDSNNFVVEIQNTTSWEKEIVIFDEDLTIVDQLNFAEDKFGLHGSILKMIEGDLIVYGWEWGQEPTGSLLRINIHTGEIEQILETDAPVDWLNSFIGENEIFVTDRIQDWDIGSIQSRYGIWNLKTGEMQLLEREGFVLGHLDFRNSEVLISESFSVGPPLRHEVIVFDLESMTEKIIQLVGEESIWARFSFDGGYIVTVNEDESVFRKYDINGMIVTEIEVYLPLTVAGSEELSSEELANIPLSRDFEIIPITDRIYVLHTEISLWSHWFFLSDHHFQFVILP